MAGVAERAAANDIVGVSGDMVRMGGSFGGRESSIDGSVSSTSAVPDSSSKHLDRFCTPALRRDFRAATASVVASLLRYACNIRSISWSKTLHGLITSSTLRWSSDLIWLAQSSSSISSRAFRSRRTSGASSLYLLGESRPIAVSVM